MGPPVPTDMICQSYSIQCKKTSSLSKSWLENKMKQMGPRRDKLHKILLHSMPIRLFQRSCGKISNSKNCLEDKMGQDEINCTGSPLFLLANLLLSGLFFLSKRVPTIQTKSVNWPKKGFIVYISNFIKPIPNAKGFCPALVPVHVFNSPFKPFFDICAQLKKLTLQKYVSHVNVMWPLPGPVPKIELDDWMCTAFPRKMILSHLWQVFQVKSSYFLESAIQRIFTLKLASPQSWRQCDEEHSTALPPPPNCCSLHVLKRSSSRSCHQQIQSPWQQWSPPNHSKYFDNTFEGDLHSPAAGARLTHCTVLAAHFTHSFLILSNNLCQHFSG